MLDARGGLFLYEVFFFRSSFLAPCFWRCMVLASLFLWIPLLFWFFGLLPSSFFSPNPSCLGHMKLWGSVGM